jgi:hypothetical protein
VSQSHHNPEDAGERRSAAEGPEAGSDEMRNLMEEAEDKADKNVTERAPETEKRQMDDGSENAS